MEYYFTCCLFIIFIYLLGPEVLIADTTEVIHSYIQPNSEVNTCESCTFSKYLCKVACLTMRIAMWTNL